jgi:hypothetical protein
MKHADAHAALDHYDRRREPDDHGELRALPEFPAPVHAVFRPTSYIGLAGRQWDEYRRRAPVFLDSFSYENAACGKYVKVVLALPFDDEDPDACPACVAEAARRAADPEAWAKEHRRRQDARRWRREEREREEEDAALWRQREHDRRQMDEWARRPDPSR